MRKDYSLFYSYKNIGDVLIVIFNNELLPTNHIRKGQVEVIYHDDNIIGYNIFDISKIIKIRSSGLIYLPSKELIHVLNTVLKNSGVEELSIIEESGYVIGQIKDIIQFEEKYIIEINIKDNIINAIKNNIDFAVGDLVVVAKENVRLNNGKLVKPFTLNNLSINGHICSENELQISEENKTLVLDIEEEIGKDFFTIG